MVRAYPEGHTVIEKSTVLTKHQAKASPPDCQVVKPVGVDPVQQFRGIRPLKFKRTQGRTVVDCTGLAGSKSFAAHRIVHGLPFVGEIKRTTEIRPGLVHGGALCHVPLRHRGGPCGNNQLATFAAPDHPETHGGKRRPKGRGTGCALRLTQFPGNKADHVGVADSALIHCHPGGRIPFDMLDRLEVLAHGQRNVRGGHVILEVDEGLARCILLRPDNLNAIADFIRDNVSGAQRSDLPGQTANNLLGRAGGIHKGRC